MLELGLNEARLFRLLVDFFGKERVVHNMSVMAVCGGQLPKTIFSSPVCDKSGINGSIDLEEWSRLNKCLFTIVDATDNAKMVIEFFSGFEEVVTHTDVEHQRYLAPILQHAGIRYVTLSDTEFAEILDPKSSLDLRAFLESKVECDDECEVIDQST